MPPLTVLCLASYRKGDDFLRQCKRDGCRVILLTSKSLEHSDWPRECIDSIYYIPDVDKEWKLDDVIHGVSYLARTEAIDRIVALDDYDVEKAAALREHLRVPGMGDTTARHFRDKLAMRTRARETGIPVPEFVHVLNYEKITAFTSMVQPPYVVKPRLQAGAIGIQRASTVDELWNVIHGLGDKQSFFLIEQFKPGNVAHVDSIVYDGEVLFALVSEYTRPPMEVAHEGRVFATRTLKRGSPLEQTLTRANEDLLKAFGLRHGVSHTEFIIGEDGTVYFLETSARVGGAHIVDLVEASSGLNLWAEWARIEIHGPGGGYRLPEHRQEYAGLLISLARQEWPDTSAYNEPEIVWRLKKKNHVGFIVRSESHERIEHLVRQYTERLYRDFFASQPLPDKPTE
jgi:biotin carboxylase